jgi:hypothetical protein
MRILLISPNIEMLPDPVAPLGLAFLSSALKSAGHEVRCLDLCFQESIDQALEKTYSVFSPDPEVGKKVFRSVNALAEFVRQQSAVSDQQKPETSLLVWLIPES